jgi:hypothetical protein
VLDTLRLAHVSNPGFQATLLYPCILALLCASAGLLVDRVSGEFLPGPLLPIIGAATLIGVSQLTTYSVVAAPATPYVLTLTAATGFALGRRRVKALVALLRAGGRRHVGWQLAAPVLAYVCALAPVLFAGRASFSSYGVLSDSAFHMLGADFLIRHGQDFSHLDLLNSSGQYLNAYYNTSYPSGADTFFGGSAFLVHVSLLWAFQPFNAFMLALATGPAWVLVRRIGLDGRLAALATLTITLPALVYGYELIASVKEITALPMILTLGALVVLHRRWLRGPPFGVVPFALVAAAGVSALGIAFGAWVLTAVVVLVAIVVRDIAPGAVVGSEDITQGDVASVASRNIASGDLGSGNVAPDRLSVRGSLLLVAVGLLVAFVAALGTWLDLSGSLQVARNIASTSNPGNLQNPLRAVQILGTWLVDSYKHVPVGGRLELSYALALIALAAALLGAAYVVYLRAYALAAWIGLTLAVWLGLTAYGTTWADGKALMLSSPVVMLLAWAGVAALRALASRSASRPRSGSALRPAARSKPDPPFRAGSIPRPVSRPAARPMLRPAFRWAAALLALALVGGVAASDALQYHGSNLAPTARYEELASLGSRFAGRGPALFTDYDEYSLYLLRNLDVGGPGFMFPPHSIVLPDGQPVDLDLIPPAALLPYPLIVIRRDPSAERPAAAYRLLWQGTYYQVWGRRPRAAPAALAHVAASGTGTVPCPSVAGLERLAKAHGAQLVSARPPQIVGIDVARASHPAWAESRFGLLMTPHGRLDATFTVPHTGVWNLWLQGEIMPPVGVSLDGHRLASVSGQLTGVATDPDTMAPLLVRLVAGSHRLTIARGSSNPLAPGSGGSAILDSIFLTPVGSGSLATLHVTPATQWHSLCGRRLEWVEAVPG